MIQVYIKPRKTHKYLSSPHFLYFQLLWLNIFHPIFIWNCTVWMVRVTICPSISISKFGFFRLCLCCPKLWTMIQHLWFSGLFIYSFTMEIWSQLKRMTCSCVRYVFLCFLLLCGVCPGEYFFLLKGKWGVFENFVIVDKLRKSTETLWITF